MYMLIFLLFSLVAAQRWTCQTCVEIPQIPQNPMIAYCPKIADFSIDYSAAGSKQILKDGGWTHFGGGRVSTKSTFNLIGGKIEFEIDISKANPGVNANIYSISPKFSGSAYKMADYCDAQKTGSDWCTEIDWIESNGNCGGGTIYHTIPGAGSGCTAWGCGSRYKYNGKTKFSMKFEYDNNGVISAYRDGNLLSITPKPLASDWAMVKKQYEDRGALIISSQWVGWVPVSECGESGKLENSSFTISNLRIFGKLVQGPAPSRC